MSDSLRQRCAAIDVLVLDVDGVLTDGRIVYTDRGEEIKAFHVRDGSGLKFWRQLGKHVGIITGRSSPIVERRARELGIDAVTQGADDKRAALERMLREHGWERRQLCAMGDDLPDVPLLRASGLAVAVADACGEAKAAAHHVTQANGGHGAVREVIELLLRMQGRWHEVLARYESAR
jgi:3-deoxy-D-manno-octulosonate 8-phosphate phosphatase (KDO 8-P phosphatase)